MNKYPPHLLELKLKFRIYEKDTKIYQNFDDLMAVYDENALIVIYISLWPKTKYKLTNLVVYFF